MSNGETGSVLGASVVAGVVVIKSQLANSGTGVIISVLAGFAVIVAVLMLSLHHRKLRNKHNK